MATGSIKIGPQYFQKELRHYSDWGMAFWRELLQNAKDGDGVKKAGEIRIEYTETSDTTAFVSVADNGPGMKREMLDKVYFVMGESGKTGTSATGGYGMARMLTCWAQQSYTIRSQDYLVSGVGADYDVEEKKTFEPGFTIQVNVNLAPRGNKVNLLEKLKYYLSRSYFAMPVYVNGERWRTWTYARKARRDLTVGQVYTNLSQSAELIVRVDGAMMFCRPLNTACQIILEIPTQISRDVMLVSRDGLLWEKQSELDSFVNELNINKRSALHERRSKSATYKGTGNFKALRKKIAKALQEAASMIATSNGIPMPAPVAVRDLHNRGGSGDHDYVPAGLSIFDVIIEDETDNVAVRKVIESYNPINWDLRGENGFRWAKKSSGWEKQFFRAGVDKYKLLCLWRAACEYGIELLFETCPTVPDAFNWGVGFIFSDRKGGCHKTTEEVHNLLINPCDESGKMRYGISGKEDLRRILGLALHEVAHIAVSYHDEDYAHTLTRLLQECDQGEAFKRMKEAKEALSTAA